MSDPFTRTGKPDLATAIERAADQIAKALDRMTAEIHRHGERTMPATDSRIPTDPHDAGFPRAPADDAEREAVAWAIQTDPHKWCEICQSARSLLTCSRPPFHNGDHIAATGEREDHMPVLARWPQVRP